MTGDIELEDLFDLVFAAHRAENKKRANNSTNLKTK